MAEKLGDVIALPTKAVLWIERHGKQWWHVIDANGIALTVLLLESQAHAVAAALNGWDELNKHVVLLQNVGRENEVLRERLEMYEGSGGSALSRAGVEKP
jgi:hypothetical protein